MGPMTHESSHLRGGIVAEPSVFDNSLGFPIGGVDIYAVAPLDVVDQTAPQD